MHVWASDVPLLIVADSESDALSEHRKAAGTALLSGYAQVGREPEVWRQLDDDQSLTIHDPEPITRRAADWARLNGPGFLAVVELIPVLPGRAPPDQPNFYGRKAIQKKRHERN